VIVISEKKAWDALQKEIGAWSDKTFPNSTPETMMRHLKKEVKELWDSNDQEVAHEIADCIMLLLHLAHRKKVSARDAIREKFEICKKRKWGKPDKHGVIQHIKE
jgi:NTP pyrophosphatase (non-canonical NTP hydrolase)